MKRSRFTEELIVFALKQAELGDLCAGRLPQAGYLRRHFLRLAQEIRRDFPFGTETHAAAGRREPQAEEAGG